LTFACTALLYLAAPATPQTAARELELLQFADYYIDRRDPRRPRFCKHCKSWKPERAHHCSVMGRCVLKMVRGQHGYVSKLVALASYQLLLVACCGK
jgi:hypothetical protein